MAVVLVNAVVTGDPLISITEFGTKFDPVTDKFAPPPPAATDTGLIDAMIGTGFETTKFITIELPPPAGMFGFEFCGGFTTTICTFPDEATSEAKIVALTSVELWNVVVRFCPFTVMIDCETKPVPVTSSENCAAPVDTPVGESDEI